MQHARLIRAAALAGLLVSLSVPTLAQDVMQRSSDTPSVRNAEKPRTTEAQQAPVSAMDPVLLNPQPLPPTPPDPIKQVTPPVSILPQAQPPGTKAPGAAVVAPPAGAATAVLPDNFFELNDRAIIVVGGKQMQVGQIKRELSAELERLSGPPVTVHSIARPGLETAANLAPPRAISHKRANVPVTAGPSGVPANKAPSHDIVQSTLTAAETIEYCKKNPAKILRVVGPLRPQQPFTIHGECFGDRSGTVEMSGLPGRIGRHGTVASGLPGKIVFEQWSNHRIVGVLPEVRGHADTAVKLTVVRADNARTAPAPADFVAARERVEVPMHKWAPNGQLRRQFASYVDAGDIHFAHASFSGESFRLAVNPSCALIDASWTQRVGTVTEFNGWEKGPPHAADVDIKWAPRCVSRSSRYFFGVAGSDSTICEIAFDLKAWAQCPLGVAP